MIAVQDIKARVAEKFCVSIADLHSPSRRPIHVRPRHIAMMLVRDMRGHSFKRIAYFFGRKDHSGVLHGIANVRYRAARNPDLAQAIADLRASLEAGDGPAQD